MVSFEVRHLNHHQLRHFAPDDNPCSSSVQTELPAAGLRMVGNDRNNSVGESSNTSMATSNLQRCVSCCHPSCLCQCTLLGNVT
jgi:hypothetical protein